MGSLMVLGGLILFSWLLFIAARDRYHREFPPGDDIPQWAQDMLDEWRDL